jgi:GNAT superfamily N-acetyltransferase
VDPTDNAIADELARMDKVCLGAWSKAPMDPLDGHWWFCLFGDEPVGYCGFKRSTDRVAYLHRTGVMPNHRGNGLQVDMMRFTELGARRLGYVSMVSDTTDNPASANSFIKRNWRIYAPKHPWAWERSVYWRKTL